MVHSKYQGFIASTVGMTCDGYDEELHAVQMCWNRRLHSHGNLYVERRQNQIQNMPQQHQQQPGEVCFFDCLCVCLIFKCNRCSRDTSQSSEIWQVCSKMTGMFARISSNAHVFKNEDQRMHRQDTIKMDYTRGPPRQLRRLQKWRWRCRCCTGSWS